MSLKTRVFLVVALVCLAPLLVVWGSGAVDDWNEARLGKRVAKAAERGAEALKTGRHLEGVARQHRVWLRLIDGSGQVRQSVDHDAVRSWWSRLGDPFFGPKGAPDLAAWDAQQPPFAERKTGCQLDGGLQVCVARVRMGEAQIISVASSRRAVRALFDRRYEVLKLTLFTVVAAVLLGLWLGFDLVRPIRSLRRQVQSRTAGASEPISLPRRDELGELAEAFNRLLAALDERSQANEAFTADLVHELKNPVAAVRTCAESLSKGKPLTGERAARLARILGDSAARMEQIVGGVLELAHAEAGLSEARSQVDLRALVEGIAARLGVERFTLEGSATVVGAPGALETAALNLMLNASQAGDHVEVHLRRSKGFVELEVADDGPPVPPEVAAHIFERFYTTREGGTGLGLPLCRAIAEAHGGALTLEENPKRFRLRLPA